MSHVITADLADAVFHTDNDTLIKYWNISLENAFGAKTDAERAELEDEIRPYALLTLVMYYEEKPVERGMFDFMLKASGLLR